MSENPKDMSKRKVYIVDDDEAVRDSLQILMESYDYEAESFESGTAFLKLAGQLGCGCVFLDVRMPDIDGLEIQARLRDVNPKLVVIIITGHGDVPMAVKAMKAGAFDFIEKPFNDDAMLDSLERAWAQLQNTLETEQQGGDDGVAERIGALTPRERDVLDQLVIGRPNKIIAYELGISPRTVEVHRARVMDKMKAKSLSHLVRMALSAGLQLNDD